MKIESLQGYANAYRANSIQGNVFANQPIMTQPLKLKPALNHDVLSL